MKKKLPFIMCVMIGLLTFSCSDRNETSQDKNTYSIAYDIIPKFEKQDSYTYHYVQGFKNPLPNSNLILIYVQTNLTKNNSPIWNLLSYTEYPNNGADKVEYSNNSSKFDFEIIVRSTNGVNLDNKPEFYTNKKFRVIEVPAKTATYTYVPTTKVDYSDYNSVINYYNIDELKIATKY